MCVCGGQGFLGQHGEPLYTDSIQFNAATAPGPLLDADWKCRLCGNLVGAHGHASTPAPLQLAILSANANSSDADDQNVSPPACTTQQARVNGRLSEYRVQRCGWLHWGAALLGKSGRHCNNTGLGVRQGVARCVLDFLGNAPLIMWM